ncbi:MAG: hypothetical protein HQ583_02745 [Candidatus Abyssubacteria bacterium]|nr:hypothetical protein [Candidatus Abyssubacteria bacterium]
MQKVRRIEEARGWMGVALVIAFIVLLVPASAAAAQDTEGADMATSLLVISFVLCVCILAVSGFSLWQSHRFYMDSVRLGREITATATELHQKVVDLIFNLRDSLARETEVTAKRERPPSRRQLLEEVSEESSDRAGKIAESISHTEEKIKALEKTLSKLHTQLSSNVQPGDLSHKLSALSDIEYAVLFKLSQDSRFFEQQSFSGFGATPKVLDSLLSRQLIVFDKDGKAEVPREVASALRHSSPEN